MKRSSGCRVQAAAIIVLSAVQGSWLAPGSAGAQDKSRLPRIASGDGPEPAIHGPRITGSTPGRPFLFKVPVTGRGPLTVTARGLPPGLSINGQAIITGSVRTAGRYRVELTAKNSLGKAVRQLEIVAGDHKLALTPPLGWNSWNVWAGAVDAEKVRRAADAMVASGLAARGYSYINIDDSWEGPARQADGQVTTNEKFPDMKALADYVHSKGLKLGIYSSPGPKTCAGFIGSYKHEGEDVASWCRWGIDYLKYDWCSYGEIEKGKTVGAFKKPYAVMRRALDQADRDIVYSLCQYGMGDVWKWGANADVHANCWRTCGDIVDSWASMSQNGFDLMSKSMIKYGGPGHWNDPDMLVLGKVGWGASQHDTKLTADEQITHMTLWSMAAAPLLIGCDMAKMDKFTLDLLTNTEVLDVNQDPLGLPAVQVVSTAKTTVWARPLFDGTVALALFNRGSRQAEVSVKWDELNRALAPKKSISGKQNLRDLWQRKNLGAFEGWTTAVPGHGAVLLKLGRGEAHD
jgi:alpha-galactosidase